MNCKKIIINGKTTVVTYHNNDKITYSIVLIFSNLLISKQNEWCCF